MKTSKLSLACTAILCLLFTSSVYTQNLIPNPGFEMGSGNTFTGWTAYNEMNGSFSEGVAEGEYRSGSRALKGEVTVAGEAWHLQLASDLIATQIGADYTFTVWVKGLSDSTSIRFSTQPNALFSANYLVTSDWTEMEWTFTANEEMTRMILDLGAEANTYFLDDMSLSGPSGEVGSCQLIDNGDFETYNEMDSTFEGWEYYNQNGGSSFGLAIGDDAFSGANALKAMSAGAIPQWGLQVATPSFSTSIGQNYTLSIMIRADIGDVNTIQFSTRDGDGGNEGQYTSTPGTIGTEWMQVSYSFSAIDDETIITMNLGGEMANTYYIDDVCVISPAPSDNCLSVMNGSFESYDSESNTFAGWSYYNQLTDSSFTLTTDSSSVYEGFNALQAHNNAGSQTWELQIAGPSFYTLQGGTYQFKIWIRAETADSNTIQFSLRDAMDPFNSETQYITTPSTIGDDWIQVSYQFTAISARSLVTLNLGGAAENTFFLDDVCVEVVCGTSYEAPEDQEPIASGKEKFLGNIYAGHALPDFEKYFNQVTPENSGKWGSVETQRDSFNWAPLDEAVQFARDNNFPFRFHVMIWGAQQPGWLENLSQEEQIEEIKEWFEAVSTRYSGENAPEYLEVVNEPINQPPSYQDALSALNTELGTTEHEYDWIVNAFKLARQYFGAETQLMINEYGIANTPNTTSQYIEIIQLLQEDDLIDAIGMQGHTFSTRKYGGTYEDLNNNIMSNLDNLAQLGLPIIVTEMDIEGDMYFDADGEPQDGGTQEQKDSFQLAEYQRIFEIFWYHPSVVGITLWGWRPGLWQDDAEAYLIDPCTGQERPALQYLNSTIRNSDPQVDIITDVEAFENSNPLVVYPTITNAELVVEGLTMERSAIRIFNVQGQMLQSIIHAGSDRRTINVSSLPTGLYVLQARGQAIKFIRQ